MKRKILYLTLTAVIATTAFFVGKNFTEQPTQPETKAPELMEMTVENGGLFLEYTDGQELAVVTENDYEYYAYKSENIYENRAFVPVEK